VITPYQSDVSKKEQVAVMFNNIAHRYDFLNHFLSLGIDKCWRKKAIRELTCINPKKILDIATGTGDLAMAALALNPSEIVGIDISDEMLIYANRKVEKAGKGNIIRFEKGDSELINYPDLTFDAAMVAFGVRNFENVQQGINEIYRTISLGGKIVVLEFSRPKNFWIRKIYDFYFLKIVPFFGKLFSNDRRAYHYLPESVEAFPNGKPFLQFLANAGFAELTYKPLTFGIASIYTGLKPDKNSYGG
jgi:demethylmenaquinone methyltransferase / 2-methoxy-6-polyprenyl-1,4-benzoquinol methylase